MSVYTPVSKPQLERFLSRYSLGELISFEGISEGIENTNFFVTTTAGDYVLTLFENLLPDQIKAYLNLTAFLNEQQVRCAHPVTNQSGSFLNELNGKPAALIERLTGRWIERPQLAQIQALGAELGKMHAVLSRASTGQPFDSIAHRRDAKWRYSVGHQLLRRLDSDDSKLLQDELHFQQSRDCSKLPAGIIHGDLFRDNVLFNGEQLSGLIDFYFAGHDYFLFDLAVVVNDWCLDVDYNIDEQKRQALVGSYHQQRPLIEAEKTAWQVALRAAALRFWLSRLENQYSPRDGEMVLQKNPDDFKKILLSHRQQYSKYEANKDFTG